MIITVSANVPDVQNLVIPRMATGMPRLEISQRLGMPLEDVDTVFNVWKRRQTHPCFEVSLSSPTKSVVAVIKNNGGQVLEDRRATPGRADLPCLGIVRVKIPVDWRCSYTDTIPVSAGAWDTDTLEMIVPDADGNVFVVQRKHENGVVSTQGIYVAR